jgi:AP-2 complex subunit beta-1
VQTFIRNAAGRALQDSPALNPQTRAVLVPLAKAELPTAINIPGPGPIESHSSQVAAEAPAANSATSASKPALPPINTEEPAIQEKNEDEDGNVNFTPVANDPYSNLGSAFGNYLQADEPQPIRRGKNVDEDELF